MCRITSSGLDEDETDDSVGRSRVDDSEDSAVGGDVASLEFGDSAPAPGWLGKPPQKKRHFYLGIARLGGGLDPCQDGLGHLFREELSKFKWAFA